jgi:hypothetical protein
LSGDYVRHYLKGIEYGAEPSFLLTYESSRELLQTGSSSRFYSTNYLDWTEEMVTLYKRYNETLGKVRQETITGHEQLAENVFQTTYSNGTRIVVNYNVGPYVSKGLYVNGQDFLVRGGG